MHITITKELHEELVRDDLDQAHSFLDGDPQGDEFWERMADITEHPPEWLKENAEGADILFVIVDDGKPYGDVTL